MVQFTSLRSSQQSTCAAQSWFLQKALCRTLRSSCWHKQFIGLLWPMNSFTGSDIIFTFFIFNNSDAVWKKYCKICANQRKKTHNSFMNQIYYQRLECYLSITSSSDTSLARLYVCDGERKHTFRLVCILHWEIIILFTDAVWLKWWGDNFNTQCTVPYYMYM